MFEDKGRHTLRQRKLHSALAVSMVGILLCVFAAFAPGIHSAQAASGDWPTYLANAEHSGFNGAETIINPTSAQHLKLLWSNSAGSSISSQPTSANGLVYWGSWDGYEHAARLNGSEIWKTYIGKTVDSSPGCSYHSVGVVGSATVTSLSIHGVKTPVAFVAGGDSSFYALNASTGAIIWRTRLGSSPYHFIWSSPNYYDGNIYIGIASFGDCPIVQGQLLQIDATTGMVRHTFDVVPAGCVGGAIWTSPTIDEHAGMLYISTGNQGSCSKVETRVISLIEMRVTDLSYVASWQVPYSQRITDSDFSSSPTLFQARMHGTLHAMVGLVNKNGIYYAFDRNNIAAGLVWEDTVALGGDPLLGQGSVSSSAWDGSTLYVAGGSTTINGKSCRGSVRAIDPATGKFLWEACLKNSVFGAVSAVPGVIVVGAGPAIIALNASTGSTLFQYRDSHMGSFFWGPASISNSVLYQGNMDGTLYAFGV